MMPAVRILTVIGNRPQFVKAAAVSRHLRDGAEEILVHTGQHYDRELSEIFFEELEVPPPDHQLEAGSGSHAEQTAAIMTGLESLVADEAPDAMLVYGDTNSTLGGALVAAKQEVPVAHVEAGMRSFDRAMPEEVNRVVADCLSDLLLCSTETAVENLTAEGRGDSAHLVGDVMADIAFTFGPIADKRSDADERLGVEPGEYLLATAHRAGNVDDPDNLALLVTVLVRAAVGTKLVFPAHPRTRARLDTAGLLDALAGANVIVSEPLGYLDFTKLVRGARAVLTDSGGLQKEAYLNKVPCVTLRNTTEWVETVDQGWNRLVGLDADAAIAALEELIERRRSEEPDTTIYGDGEAGKRVSEEITRWLG